MIETNDWAMKIHLWSSLRFAWQHGWEMHDVLRSWQEACLHACYKVWRTWQETCPPSVSLVLPLYPCPSCFARDERNQRHASIGPGFVDCLLVACLFLAWVRCFVLPVHCHVTSPISLYRVIYSDLCKNVYIYIYICWNIYTRRASALALTYAYKGKEAALARTYWQQVLF
jgi:hypothetical protein